jgi:hypothetical protein
VQGPRHQGEGHGRRRRFGNAVAGGLPGVRGAEHSGCVLSDDPILVSALGGAPGAQCFALFLRLTDELLASLQLLGWRCSGTIDRGSRRAAMAVPASPGIVPARRSPRTNPVAPGRRLRRGAPTSGPRATSSRSRPLAPVAGSGLAPARYTPDHR